MAAQSAEGFSPAWLGHNTFPRPPGSFWSALHGHLPSLPQLSAQLIQGRHGVHGEMMLAANRQRASPPLGWSVHWCTILSQDLPGPFDQLFTVICLLCPNWMLNWFKAVMALVVAPIPGHVLLVIIVLGTTLRLHALLQDAAIDIYIGLWFNFDFYCDQLLHLGVAPILGHVFW